MESSIFWMSALIFVSLSWSWVIALLPSNESPKAFWESTMAILVTCWA